MRFTLLPALALTIGASAAWAASEGKFSQATVNGLTKTLEADGCKMGEIHSGDGFYTVAGAECADGTYNVTVDTNFKVTDKKKKE